VLQSKTGRELLKELVDLHEESVMTFYKVLTDFYPYLLEKHNLSREEINRYNSLAASNVYNINIRNSVKER
jgi:hypothetical protein